MLRTIILCNVVLALRPLHQVNSYSVFKSYLKGHFLRELFLNPFPMVESLFCYITSACVFVNAYVCHAIESSLEGRTCLTRNNMFK